MKPHQMQTVETVLDAASIALIDGVGISDALAKIAKAVAIVREVPPGFRRIRKDAGTERENLPPRVTPV